MTSGKATVTRRYQLYCIAHGIGVAEVKGYAYINWINQKWVQWRTLNSYTPQQPLTPERHEQFDTWLQEEVMS